MEEETVVIKEEPTCEYETAISATFDVVECVETPERIEASHFGSSQLAKSSLLFRCDYCDKTFDKASHKTEHVDSVHKKIRYECPECHKLFTATRFVVHHLRMFHKIKSVPKTAFQKIQRVVGEVTSTAEYSRPASVEQVECEETTKRIDTRPSSIHCTVPLERERPMVTGLDVTIISCEERARIAHKGIFELKSATVTQKWWIRDNYPELYEKHEANNDWQKCFLPRYYVQNWMGNMRKYGNVIAPRHRMGQTASPLSTRKVKRPNMFTVVLTKEEQSLIGRKSEELKSAVLARNTYLSEHYPDEYKKHEQYDDWDSCFLKVDDIRSWQAEYVQKSIYGDVSNHHKEEIVRKNIELQARALLNKDDPVVHFQLFPTAG